MRFISILPPKRMAKKISATPPRAPFPNGFPLKFGGGLPGTPATPQKNKFFPSNGWCRILVGQYWHFFARKVFLPEKCQNGILAKFLADFRFKKFCPTTNKFCPGDLRWPVRQCTFTRGHGGNLGGEIQSWISPFRTYKEKNKTHLKSKEIIIQNNNNDNNNNKMRKWRPPPQNFFRANVSRTNVPIGTFFQHFFSPPPPTPGWVTSRFPRPGNMVWFECTDFLTLSQTTSGLVGSKNKIKKTHFLSFR